MTGGAPVQLMHDACDCPLCVHVRRAASLSLESRLETLAAKFLADRLRHVVDDERSPCDGEREGMGAT